MHRRSAADGRADADQQGEPARNAERPAHQNGEGQGRNERDGDHDERARAEVGGLTGGDLQTEQDDREAQQPAQRKFGAVPGRCWGADEILHDDADEDREDHRAERRDAGKEPQSKGESGDAATQSEPGREIGELDQGGGKGDLSLEIGHGTNSSGIAFIVLLDDRSIKPNVLVVSIDEIDLRARQTACAGHRGRDKPGHDGDVRRAFTPPP